MTKVLILQGDISSYNIPIYKLLSRDVDLTVAYFKKNESANDLCFNVIKLEHCTIFKIVFIKSKFYEFCKKYDVVIFSSDLHFFSFCTLPFVRRPYKVIPWTIGVRASYKRRYNVDNKKSFIDEIFGLVLRKSDAVLFYMKEPVKFWGRSILNEKIFIAHNTVEVKSDYYESNIEKKSILFIGTLYKEKKIYELINSYIEAKMLFNMKDFLKLYIIGDGEEYENLKSIIKNEKLEDCVFLLGPIYDERLIAKYFSNALLCISPDQAGLSVLKSMGHGVPYVTRKNAITGGERFNISDKVNGLFYNNNEELVSIIKDAYQNPEKFIKMGINAKNYYNSTATINHMVAGFINAINYVMK